MLSIFSVYMDVLSNKIKVIKATICSQFPNRNKTLTSQSPLDILKCTRFKCVMSPYLTARQIIMAKTVTTKDSTKARIHILLRDFFWRKQRRVTGDGHCATIKYGDVKVLKQHCSYLVVCSTLQLLSPTLYMHLSTLHISLYAICRSSAPQT